MSAWRWFWLLLLLNGFDWLCTDFEVHRMGEEVEANPLMSAAMKATGSPTIIFAIKTVMFVALAYGLIKLARERSRLPVRPILKTLSFLFGALALWHAIVLAHI